MAAYRTPAVSERWQLAYTQLAEDELPADVQQAFNAFTVELRQRHASAPSLIEVGGGARPEAYYPSYAAMKTEGMVGTVFGAAFLWLMGVGVGCMLGVPLMFVLPETLIGPALLAVLILASVLCGAWAFRTVFVTGRRNRIKRAAGGPIAYGTFILEGAVVTRFPEGCGYYPRHAVKEVVVERVAAHLSGGHRGPQREHGPSSDVFLSYRDIRGGEERLPILPGAIQGHDPEPAKRLRAWLTRDADAAKDTDFGSVGAAELANSAFAAGWRRFRRWRLATMLAAAIPTLLFVVVAVLTNAIDELVFITDFFDDAPWTLFVIFILPLAITWPIYERIRCPRCDKSPDSRSRAPT